jgi:Ca2+-binding EF-hand superfamily protein
MTRFYDTNGDGQITWAEFLQHLRQPMSYRQNSIVEKAWASLDPQGSGLVDIKQVEETISLD